MTVRSGAAQRVRARLAGGDRRSIGDADALATEAIADRRLFDALVAGLGDEDPVVRMRCADAAEKVSRRRPEWLLVHKSRLLGLLAVDEQSEVRWHVAPMVARLALSADERRRATAILSRYLDARSAIVRVQAMQALADLAAGGATSVAPLLAKLRALSVAGPPSVRARARKLVVALASRASGARSTKRRRATSA